MRLIGTLLLLLTVGYFAFAKFMKLDRFEQFPTEILQEEMVRINLTVLKHDAEMTVPEGGLDSLRKMKQDQHVMEIELQKRKYRVDQWIPWAGGVGILLFLLPWGRRLFRRSSEVIAEQAVLDDVEIPEALPREEYVNDWDFERKIQSGFRTRDEAVAWLLQDPLLKCDYCGAQLKPTGEGAREAVQLVTFYKKVPEGANDLRIVLGSYWFTKSASKLKCASCHRVVKR